MTIIAFGMLFSEFHITGNNFHYAFLLFFGHVGNPSSGRNPFVRIKRKTPFRRHYACGLANLSVMFNNSFLNSNVLNFIISRKTPNTKC